MRALGLTMIDEKLRELVVDLNAAGFVTEGTCQGRRHEHEFTTGTHTPAGYLSFSERMPDRVIAELEKRGRHIYGDGRAVTAIAVVNSPRGPNTVIGYRAVNETRSIEDWTVEDGAVRRVIAANERFLEDVREAFAVPETKELLLDVVYFGPALSGRTSNLQHLYANVDSTQRTKMESQLEVPGRWLAFTTVPKALPKIGERSIRLRFVTSPGTLFDPEGEERMLETADAIVFVADSQVVRREANVEWMERLAAHVKKTTFRAITDLPFVLQYNKRDLPEIVERADLERDLNAHGCPSFDAIAREGVGVFDTAKEVARLVAARLLPRE